MTFKTFDELCKFVDEQHAHYTDNAPIDGYLQSTEGLEHQRSLTKSDHYYTVMALMYKVGGVHDEFRIDLQRFYFNRHTDEACSEEDVNKINFIMMLDAMKEKLFTNCDYFSVGKDEDNDDDIFRVGVDGISYVVTKQTKETAVSAKTGKFVSTEKNDVWRAVCD